MMGTSPPNDPDIILDNAIARTEYDLDMLTYESADANKQSKTTGRLP